MTEEKQHARLSASSAHRWMACTPSVCLENTLPDVSSSSSYASEGTLAHAIGEVKLSMMLNDVDREADLRRLRTDPQYTPAMDEHTDSYVAHVMSQACNADHVEIEQRVDYSDWVDNGFGTCDALIIKDRKVIIIDFKYGAGVPVSAVGNPQMMLYALGAYAIYSLIYNDLESVEMHIFQPRLDDNSVWCISVSDLIRWAENELRPKAELAHIGAGDFNPGEYQCRWCKAKAVCVARAEYMLDLAKYEFREAAILKDDEIAEVLSRASELVSWAETVKAYAQNQAINHGVHYPGWKVVEGRSNRKYTDESAIASTLVKAGYSEQKIYKPKEILGITAMESLIGKKTFANLIGHLVIKPEGAPVLVPETDKRPAFNSLDQAKKEFN